MKHIKTWVAPIKIFIAAILSTILALLTMVVMLPVGYLFNIGDTGGLIMYTVIQLIYFISTLSYFFDFITIYRRWRYRVEANNLNK